MFSYIARLVPEIFILLYINGQLDESTASIFVFLLPTNVAIHITYFKFYHYWMSSIMLPKGSRVTLFFPPHFLPPFVFTSCNGRKFFLRIFLINPPPVFPVSALPLAAIYCSAAHSRLSSRRFLIVLLTPMHPALPVCLWQRFGRDQWVVSLGVQWPAILRAWSN